LDNQRSEIKRAMRWSSSVGSPLFHRADRLRDGASGRCTKVVGRGLSTFASILVF